MFLNNIIKRRILVRLTVLAYIALGSLIYGTGCHNEPAEPKSKIESIIFDKERITIKIDEETTVKVTAKPDEAKKNEKISYTSVNDGIIEIREPTNDGFIVKGLKGGSTVITAKSKEVTNYLEITVEGESIITQYITVAQPVIEMLEGERKSTQVALYGGSMLDNNDFVWRLENGKNNISIDITANIVVISGLSRGYQKIIVSHPKAEYESEILVFVKGVDEAIQYLSSQSNVLLVPNDGQYHNFNMTLVNGKPEDIINFGYEVIEGIENVEIVANGDVCNVKGVHSGSSVIRVTHPLAVMEFDLRIIVYDVNIPFIIIEKTFVLMNIGDSVNIAAQVENARNPVTAMNEFSYEIVENSSNIVDIVQNNNYFFIRAQHGGNARIIISNNQTEVSREILIIVRDEIILRDDFYITTSQNVIQTQVGAAETQLYMQLVNGNNADANGFEWIVDDGTIIKVESPHGIVRGNRAQINSVFNAVAVITPKKAGTAKITVSHPKSEVSAIVMVKVYPKGTFVETPILVGVDGLIKVIKGTPETVQLRMVSGDILNVGSLDWAVTDTAIATVNTGAHGMVNILNGLNNGLTKLIISGQKLENPHESLILAGTPEYVSNASVIFVDSVYQKILTEQVVRIEVKDSQGIYSGSNDFKAVVEDKNLLYSVMTKNQLVLQGKEPGETKVIISHPSAINDITVNVRIDPAHLTIDKPYYISGPEIIGLVRGRADNLTVSLVGAGGSEEGGLKWAVEDSSIVSVMANGREAILTGRISNRQTKLTVSHKKAENEKTVLVYVVENESDLYNKVVLGLKNDHYLLTTDEEVLITLTTNANETQKSGITWAIQSDENVLTIDPHYDSAMVKAVKAGNAKITIAHPDNILSQIVYVSVVDTLSGEKVIQSPAIIELVKGDSKIVSVNHINVTPAEVENIRWSVEDSAIANVQENGDSAYMLGLNRGISYVNIKQDQIGYKHRATLMCANPGETLYVMGVDQSYHVMNIGDEKKIKLEFGSNGFPENEKRNITWTASESGAVRVAPNGDEATVIANAEGYGTVKVRSSTSFNEELIIDFEVRGNKLKEYEFRGHDKIVGLVVGNSKQVAMKIYSGPEEITNGYSLLKYENENDNIIRINPVENILDITAKMAGQSYITVRHNLVSDPARILVYTANTQEELDLYYPIVADKTNYLLQVGEQATIRINTIESKDPGNLNKVIWGLENASIINMPVSNGKKEAVITGRASGQCIININYEGRTVERIFISVTENNAIDMSKYIMTENIIGIVKGQSHTTAIVSNLSASEISSLIWDSDDHDTVTVSGNGATAVITAQSPAGNNRETYVTVTYGSWLKRHILVYVCDTEDQVKQYKAMNIENQYLRLGKNENIILPLYYGPNKTAVPTVWVDKYDNKVVQFNSIENGGKLEILTLNEGVAVLEAVNTGLSNTGRVLRIYIEVSNQYKNLPQAPQVPENKYLTAAKTMYLLNPEETEVYADISVIGIGMTVEELTKVRWNVESGNHLISIYPNGKDCRVRVNQSGFEGTAVLQASLTNIISFKVVVSKNKMLGFPHIVGNDVVKVGKGDKVMVEYAVAELETYKNEDFSFEVRTGSNIVDVKMAGNLLEVEGKTSGQALLNIKHEDCEHGKEVIVIVTTTPGGLIYLTTRDNFSAIKINEYKTLNVDMIGYENAPDQGYIWTIDPVHKNVVNLEGADDKGQFKGKQAQVKGLAAGTAKIVISNPDYVDSLYNLAIFVRVTNAETKMVYITTPKNIVSVKENQSAYIEAELVNGGPGDDNLFRWQSMNPGIVSVEGAGKQAVIVGKQAGIGRVQIFNDYPAVNSGTEILVIVEKDSTDPSIYISASNTLYDMKPTEKREVTLRLIGGNDNDVYGFVWEIINSVPIDPHKTEIIRLTREANRAYIEGINEGEATIKVTHPKTTYALEIKVYVRYYNAIKFSKRNVTVDIGKTEFVDVECPSGVAVAYTATKLTDPVTGLPKDVVSISGTNKVCAIEGIAEGICYVYASNPQGTMSDEIIVQVRKVENRLVRYIQTPDVLYNMTDWQSALNRAMITGATVGEKNNGKPFTETDDAKIRWRITDSNDVIAFGYSGTSATRLKVDEGKSVSVYSIKPGTGEIELRHPEMPEYSKKVYVFVSAYDANFRIEPYFLNLQIGQESTVEATISNLPEVDYSKVTWSVTQNEKGEDGIEIVSNESNNKILKIKALKAGVCQVKAVFNGVTTVECSVYVEPVKSLNISESYVTILPNETREIRYTVEPAGSEVKHHKDYNEYVDIISTANGILTIKGKEKEGFTQITLTSNYIERVVTVNTNYNFVFALKDITAVRGKPGDTVPVNYIVYPQGDTVTYKGGGKQFEGTPFEIEIARPVNINIATQTINIQLVKCGYTELVFQSAYNSQMGFDLVIPVYIYYDKIDLQWVEVDKESGNKSRLDNVTDAIYVANNEIIYIDFRRYNGDALGYAGANIQYGASSSDWGGVIGGEGSGVTWEFYDNNSNDNKITRIIKITGNPALTGSKNYLSKVEYKGKLDISYRYYTGGKNPSVFRKTFMVYQETWK
jgi:hypothetical protein